MPEENMNAYSDWQCGEAEEAKPGAVPKDPLTPMSEFTSGALREDKEGKPRPDLESPHARSRLATVLAKGGVAHGDRNWEKGMPVTTFYASLQRHLMQWELGENNEDHLAHAMFNLMAMIHFDEVGPEELKDHPRYHNDH